MTVVAVLVAVGAVVVASVAMARARSANAEAARIPQLERDLDEQRDRATASADVAARLRSALDSVPQGVVIVDESGEVVSENRAASEAAGSRHGEALVRGAVEDLLAAAGAGRRGERTVELFGPPPRVVEVVAEPLPGGALVVIDDITEARRVDAVRRDFVANLSHELKTPVGAIGLLAETLLDELDADVARRLTERVVNESFRVSRTIDDLLELSRIEAGGEIPHQPVPVHLVLEEAVDRLRPAAELRDITIRTGGVSARVSTVGERRQLVSAVANLLDNAVKYSAPASTVELRATTDGATVTIEVEDHGLGIPPRDVERIFERFYRVDRARSRETGGTGLGLAIVRHIVSNHGGEVTVRSTEGEGSTFALHLRSGPGPVAVAEPADPAEPRRSA